MTDQFTSLTPAAIKEIIAHIDESISVFEKYRGRMTGTEVKVKSMLITLRAQLIEQLGKQHDSQG